MTILCNRSYRFFASFTLFLAIFILSSLSVCFADDLTFTFNDTGNDYINIKTARDVEITSFKVNNPYRLVVDVKNVSVSPAEYTNRHKQIKKVLVNKIGDSARIVIEPVPGIQLFVKQNLQSDITIFGTQAVSDGMSQHNSVAEKPHDSRSAVVATGGKPQSSAPNSQTVADSLVIKDGMVNIGTNGFIEKVSTYSIPESNRFVFVLENTVLAFKQGRYKLDFHNLTGMDAEQQGNNARLTFYVEPNTTVPNYFANKDTNSLQIRFFMTDAVKDQAPERHVKKQVTVQEPPTAVKYRGPRISLDFDNADLRHIFRLLAEVNKKNYVLSDDVKGTMSLKLINVPWEQAQELILRSHNLVVVEEGNVTEIITVAQKAERIKRQLEFDDFSKSQEQISICAVQLRHAASTKVAEAASTILNRGGKEVSSDSAAKVQAQSAADKTVISDANRADVKGILGTDLKAGSKSNVFSINNIYPEPNTNRLIIRDYPSKFPEILKVLSLLDVADNQVMIEARIIEASSDFQRSLGVQWGIHYRDGSASFMGINSLDTGFGGITSEPPLTGTSGPGMSTGISFGTLASNINLDLKFSAAAGAGMIKIVSTPKVAVAYGETATIKDGKKQPYQTTSANSGTQTQFVEAVLSLKVKPTITPSCDVVMEINVTNDSVGSGSPPPINQKSAETKLTVKNGETAVIGGTYVNSETEQDDGVPYLMEIPLLGRLFKSKTSTKNNRELLIFITPKLLNANCSGSKVMTLKYEKLECSTL